MIYSPGFEKFLKTHGLMDKGNNYNTVAVIGCQSSGKSILLEFNQTFLIGTLLNLLFGTKFEILDANKGRM